MRIQKLGRCRNNNHCHLPSIVHSKAEADLSYRCAAVCEASAVVSTLDLYVVRNISCLALSRSWESAPFTFSYKQERRSTRRHLTKAVLKLRCSEQSAFASAFLSL